MERGDPAVLSLSMERGDVALIVLSSSSPIIGSVTSATGEGKCPVDQCARSAHQEFLRGWWDKKGTGYDR